MNIGYALTGSFCTIEKSLEVLRNLSKKYKIVPIVSPIVECTNTRFGNAAETLNQLDKICGCKPICSIKDAEPLGPTISLDAMIICPCTGNTLAKLANSITDTTVTMAAKAHLRNNRPLIVALATNDALSQNLSNISVMLNRKSVYFVPLGQDNSEEKPYSLIANFDLVENTLDEALKGKQIQPLLI